MYGLGDQMMEDQKNLAKLDNMVTIAKKALNEIRKQCARRENYDVIRATAAEALLAMIDVGGK